MLRLITLVFFCGYFLAPPTLGAQETILPNVRRFVVGFGFPLVKFRDETVSPQLNRGIGIQIRLGYEETTRDALHKIDLLLTIATFGHVVHPASHMRNSGLLTQFQVMYGYYRLVQLNDRHNTLLVGGVMSHMFDFRNYGGWSFVNNDMTYMINNSLNIAAQWRYRPNLSEQGVQLNYQVFTPIISFSARPTYIGTRLLEPHSFGWRSPFSTGRIILIPKLFRYCSELQLDIPKPYNNIQRITYSWDYHYSRVSKKLNMVLAGLGYNHLFRY